MNTNLVKSAVRNLSVALLVLSSLMFPGSGGSEVSSDLGLLLPRRIAINSTTFHLLRQETWPDPSLGTKYRYQSSDSQTLDVFVFPVDKQRYAPGLPFLDQEVTWLLLTLDELKARRMYESAYAELSREIYYQVANKKVSGRRVILRMTKAQIELRSLFVIVSSQEKMIKFRYTVPAKEFREREFDEFVRAWLSIALNGQEDSPALTPQPHTIQERDANLDKESEDKRQTILRELERRWQGRVLGKFNDVTKHITLDSTLLEDPDLSLAILCHELVHAAYPREEEQDREIDKIASMHGIALRNEDYQVWGKSELAADLLTLAVLSDLGRHSAIQKYVALRGIRHEVAAPFLRRSLEHRSDKN